MIQIENAIWVFVIVFMLHDFEEIISVENWAKRTENMLQDEKNWIKRNIWRFWNVNSYSFAKRDIFIFLTMSIITFLKVQYLESTCSSMIFVFPPICITT